MFFKLKKESCKTGTVKNLADGCSLFALLVATEHSSDTYTSLSDESLISKYINFSSLFPLFFSGLLARRCCVLWIQKVRHLAGKSGRC